MGSEPGEMEANGHDRVAEVDESLTKTESAWVLRHRKVVMYGYGNKHFWAHGGVTSVHTERSRYSGFCAKRATMGDVIFAEAMSGRTLQCTKADLREEHIIQNAGAIPANAQNHSTL